MNKLGIFINFWENEWMAEHVKYIKKAADTGFDILEFQAQPLLEMTEARLDEIFGALAYINYQGRIVSEPFVMSGGQIGRGIYVR